MTRYVTHADLSFPLAPKDPETGEKQRVRQVHGVRLENAFPLPWPMTPGGARLYVLFMAIGTIGAVALGVWAGFALFEPSLLRLVPAACVVLAIKFLVVPALHAYGRRPGMDRRGGEGE